MFIERIYALMLSCTDGERGAEHVSVLADLVLPADADTGQAVARQAVNAFARSAGIAAWDAPRTAA